MKIEEKKQEFKRESKDEVRVCAPATLANIGPGFDCLGICLDSLRDTLTVSASESGIDEISVSGRDAAAVPLDFEKNIVGAVAYHLRKHLGVGTQRIRVHIERALPMSGGLGSSAAAAIAAALAYQHFFKVSASVEDILNWALAGEELAAGRHLDNLAPCLLGGLTLSFFHSGTPVLRSFSVNRSPWFALVTPRLKISTRKAREVLPERVSSSEYCEGISRAAGVALALSQGDFDLLHYSLIDPYATPQRSQLIPLYQQARAKALQVGALGFGISGSGPTLFAACESLDGANKVCEGLGQIYAELGCSTHVCRIAHKGAFVLD